MSTTEQRTAFEERVAQTAYDDVEAEFIARGAQAGVTVLPLEAINGTTESARARASSPAVPPASSRPRPTPIAPGRARPTPIPPAPRRAHTQGASGTPANKRDKSKRREYRVVQTREPVDFWLEPSEDELRADPEAQPELLTVHVRRVPATEIPYLDRYEAMLIRLRHQMADLKVDGPKAQTRLDRMAGEYNNLMEEMTLFSVDMPEGAYARLTADSLAYLQTVIRELARPATDDDEEEDDEGNW